jgi:penicillin-binding protein 1A
VAGAWVGFNDSRVTLRSDYWGQGAHSALPIVGDFFQRSMRSRLIDSRERFPKEEETGTLRAWLANGRAWVSNLFASKPASEPPAKPRPATRRVPAAPAAPAPSSPHAPEAVPPIIASQMPAEMPPLLPLPSDAPALGEPQQPASGASATP